LMGAVQQLRYSREKIRRYGTYGTSVQRLHIEKVIIVRKFCNGKRGEDEREMAGTGSSGYEHLKGLGKKSRD